jgi:hypothetical protein
VLLNYPYVAREHRIPIQFHLYTDPFIENSPVIEKGHYVLQLDKKNLTQAPTILKNINSFIESLNLQDEAATLKAKLQGDKILLPKQLLQYLTYSEDLGKYIAENGRHPVGIEYYQTRQETTVMSEEATLNSTVSRGISVSKEQLALSSQKTSEKGIIAKLVSQKKRFFTPQHTETKKNIKQPGTPTQSETVSTSNIPKQ